MSLRIHKNELSASPKDQQKSIEDYLQSIVNVSSQIMEIVEVPSGEFSDIEKRFEQSSTFEEVLLVIEYMACLSLEKMKKGKVTEIRKRKEERPKQNESHSFSGLANSSYEELEKLLQKYEAEIREHIKVEQQMKIYSDNLEEKIAEMEAAVEAEVNRSRLFEKEVQRLKCELENFQTEKQTMKTKIQLANGRGLAISVPKHRKTQSIDTAGHQNTQIDMLASIPNDPKIDTKKNPVGGKCLGGQRLRKAFNFQGKAMFSNLKNFYEDFMGKGLKVASKANSNSRSENDSIRFPMKTLEKVKENSRPASRK